DDDLLRQRGRGVGGAAGSAGVALRLAGQEHEPVAPGGEDAGQRGPGRADPALNHQQPSHGLTSSIGTVTDGRGRSPAARVRARTIELMTWLNGWTTASRSRSPRASRSR